VCICLIAAILGSCTSTRVDDARFRRFLSRIEPQDSRLFDDDYVIWEDDVFLWYEREIDFRRFTITVTHTGVVGVQVRGFGRGHLISQMSDEQVNMLREAAIEVLGAAPSGFHWGESEQAGNGFISVYAMGESDEVLFAADYFDVEEHEAIQPFKELLFEIMQTLDWYRTGVFEDPFR